jgi:RNA-directed DNA polymerase
MDDIELDQWKQFFDVRVSGRRGRALAASYLSYIEGLDKLGLPPIFEFAHLAALVGVDYVTLAKMAHEPHKFYRTFAIPKRSGGIRNIDTPRPILLEVQRWILENILSKLNISDQAHGFVKGRSIITNAKAHVGSKELLKLDLKDFFPSVSYARVFTIFREAGYPDNVSGALSRLTTKNSCLPQGAPTSPSLSNLSCLELDAQLNKIAIDNGLVYTRYADDLSFSGEAVPIEMASRISTAVDSAGFTINTGKTTFSREGNRKIVTGVSISSGELRLPRRYLRELKKQIHFVVKHGVMEHGKATGNRDPLILDRLLGMVSFWLQVSPESRSAQDADTKLRAYITQFDAS